MDQAPKKEAPKKEAPKKEAPKKEAPKKEAPKKEAPKKEAVKEETPKKDARIVVTLDRFIENIEGIHVTFPLFMELLKKTGTESSKKYTDYLEKNGTVQKVEKGQRIFTLDRKHFLGADKLKKDSARAIKSLDLIPRNFIVSLISEYDSFLGNLLKVFYSKKPELLEGIERQITYSDLVNYKSIEDARDYILEKEIESILRKSHIEQFEVLEKKFSLNLRKGLSIWSDFVEITERRNLFVHCDGVVSSQYLKNCITHNCILEKSEVGSRLNAPTTYIQETFQILNEISIKLTHVLWRKVFPHEQEEADAALMKLTFDLLQQERYELVSNVLDLFVNTHKKFHDDIFHRIFIVNLALSYKLSGQKEKCNNELKKHDWSAVGYNFKIAYAVLSEKYDLAASYMDKVVAIKDLGEVEFLQWPIFKEFRESKEFAPAFLKCFGKEPFANESLEMDAGIDLQTRE